MLTCSNLTSVRGYKKLFSGLGFSLFPGSIMIVEGANGSGKSTLLRMMAGLMEPKEGQVLLENIPLREHPSYPRVLQYIGHKNAIFSELTVRENLTQFARIKGDEILVPSAMSHFGLEAYADIPAGKLSAGWQRKVSLSKLLLSPSPVWILDEPFTHLDEQASQMLSAVIKSRAQQGGMVVVASHTRYDSVETIYININNYN